MMRIDRASSLMTWHALQSEVDGWRNDRARIDHVSGLQASEVRESLDELLPAMQWYADLWKAELLRAMSPPAGLSSITTATDSGTAAHYVVTDTTTVEAVEAFMRNPAGGL